MTAQIVPTEVSVDPDCRPAHPWEGVGEGATPHPRGRGRACGGAASGEAGGPGSVMRFGLSEDRRTDRPQDVDARPAASIPSCEGRPGDFPLPFARFQVGRPS